MEWQPIETAPDDTEILTCRGKGLMAVAQKASNRRGGHAWFIIDGPYIQEGAITHWMPLPEPPKC